MKLPENMYAAYDDITRALEMAPGGLTYDVLQSKLASLKRLRRKELVTLLSYIKTRDRITVIPTTRRDAADAPLLRHKMHTGEVTSVPVAPVPKEESVVFVATAGRPALQKPETVKEEPTMKPETAAVTEPVDVQTLRDANLPPYLHKAADEIVGFLVTNPQGATRTDINQQVMSYHVLRGANRQVVLSYLTRFEGILEVVVGDGDGRRGGRFYHPTFQYTLPASAQRLDHSAPQLTLDPVTPMLEPTVPTGQPEPQQDSAKPQLTFAEIGQLVIDAIEDQDGEMPMYDLHRAVPEYHDLNDNDRRDCIQALVKADKVRTYRVPNNTNGVLWIHLYKEAEDNKSTIAHSTGETPSTMASAFMDVLSKQTAKSTPPVVPEPVSVTEPVAPVVTTPVTTTPKSEAIRAQIALLEKLASDVEREEDNASLREELRPLRDAVVAEYQNVQDALSLQIDAVAAMGIAIEKLNNAIEGK